jgi:6-phosphogluconolactonase (cycloisomerase 2 family)
VGVVEKRASTFVYTATPDTGDVHSFRLNSDRTLTPLNSFESNNGPLGVSVHGPLLFVANEGGGGGESFLTSFRAKNNGDLKRAPTQSVAVGPGLVGETYNVFVSPNGKTLYAADTSASQIFGYRVNQSNAALTPLSGSPFPTAAVVNPTGLALAKSLVVLLGSNTSGLDDLQVFRRLGNGDLQALSGLQNSGIKSQKAAALSPDGKILVSASEANDQVRSFLVDGATGALTPVETETAETGKVNGVVIITR